MSLFMADTLALQRILGSAVYLPLSHRRRAGCVLGTRIQLSFTPPGNVLDSDPSVSMQLRARTRPVANKESAWRPSATTPAPATPGSTGQSVNPVRQLSCWYSRAGGEAGKETTLETSVSKGSS